MAKIQETREVADFDSLSLSGSGELIIVQNTDLSQPVGLVIETEDATLPHLTSEVRDGRLYLGLKSPGWDLFAWLDWFTLPKWARYYVTVNDLKGVVISGSGKLNANTLDVDQLDINVSGSATVEILNLECTRLASAISGSGTFTFSGEADEHVLRVSGSGRLNAPDFATESTSISISGSGRAVVRVEQELKVSISGSGDVQYIGEPKINQSISGSGKVHSFEPAPQP